MTLKFTGTAEARERHEEWKRAPAKPGEVLTPEQQKRLAAENIRRCKAYAALPPEQKWKGAAAEGKVIRARKRTHAVHVTYTGAPLRASLMDRID